MCDCEWRGGKYIKCAQDRQEATLTSIMLLVKSCLHVKKTEQKCFYVVLFRTVQAVDLYTTFACISAVTVLILINGFYFPNFL